MNVSPIIVCQCHCSKRISEVCVGDLLKFKSRKFCKPLQNPSFLPNRINVKTSRKQYITTTQCFLPKLEAITITKTYFLFPFFESQYVPTDSWSISITPCSSIITTTKVHTCINSSSIDI